MPVWFIASIAATFLWAIVNLIDDNLLSKVYRTARFGAIISGLFGFSISFYLFITNDVLIRDPKIVIPAVAAGALTIVFYFFYFKTLESDEPSVAVALNNLAPALVPFLAFLFLSETLELKQYLGLALIVFSSFLIALIDTKSMKLSSAIKYSTLGAISYAFVSILAKYAYEQAAFRDVYVWVTFGFGVGALAFLCFSSREQRRDYTAVIKKSPPMIVLVLILGEIINIAAELLQGYAISSGPVSVVRGIEGTQSMFVLLIGISLSPFFPKLFREVKDKKLPRKLVCMAMMLVGLFLIY